MALFNLVQSPAVVVAIDSVSEWAKEIDRIGLCAYLVTGMSPQSRTVAQLLKGFVASGTLYPPLLSQVRSDSHHANFFSMNTYYRFSLRLPWRIPEGPKRAPGR